MAFIHIESFSMPSQLLAQCPSEAEHERLSPMNPLLLKIPSRGLLDSLPSEAGHERLLAPQKGVATMASERLQYNCFPSSISRVRSSSPPKMNPHPPAEDLDRLDSLLSVPDPPKTGLTERAESTKPRADSRPARGAACNETNAEMEEAIRIMEWAKDRVLRVTEDAERAERQNMDEDRFKLLLSKWKSQARERGGQEAEEHLLANPQEGKKGEMVWPEKSWPMSGALRRRDKENRRGLALLLTFAPYSVARSDGPNIICA